MKSREILFIIVLLNINIQADNILMRQENERLEDLFSDDLNLVNEVVDDDLEENDSESEEDEVSNDLDNDRSS